MSILLLPVPERFLTRPVRIVYCLSPIREAYRPRKGLNPPIRRFDNQPDFLPDLADAGQLRKEGSPWLMHKVPVPSARYRCILHFEHLRKQVKERPDELRALASRSPVWLCQLART